MGDEKQTLAKVISAFVAFKTLGAGVIPPARKEQEKTSSEQSTGKETGMDGKANVGTVEGKTG